MPWLLHGLWCGVSCECLWISQRAILDFFNLVLGYGASSEKFWEEVRLGTAARGAISAVTDHGNPALLWRVLQVILPSIANKFKYRFDTAPVWRGYDSSPTKPSSSDYMESPFHFVSPSPFAQPQRPSYSQRLAKSFAYKHPVSPAALLLALQFHTGAMLDIDAWVDAPQDVAEFIRKAVGRDALAAGRSTLAAHRSSFGAGGAGSGGSTEEAFEPLRAADIYESEASRSGKAGSWLTRALAPSMSRVQLRPDPQRTPILANAVLGQQPRTKCLGATGAGSGLGWVGSISSGLTQGLFSTSSAHHGSAESTTPEARFEVSVLTGLDWAVANPFFTLWLLLYDSTTAMPQALNADFAAAEAAGEGNSLQGLRLRLAIAQLHARKVS